MKGRLWRVAGGRLGFSPYSRLDEGGAPPAGADGATRRPRRQRECTEE